MTTEAQIPIETQRYARQLALPGFGNEQQMMLQLAKVAVIGCGGLGCSVLQYLCAAGVGHLILADADIVSDSNLHRQILFAEGDIGKMKVNAAAEKMRCMNSKVQLAKHAFYVTAQNAIDILHRADVLVDCTDNFSARFLLSDAAVKLGKPLVHAAIHQYEGWLSVFNHLQDINYRDVHTEPPAAGTVPDCNTGGVMGALAGMLGSMQANEVIKLITKIGITAEGTMLHIDTLYNTFNTFSLRPNPNNKVRQHNQHLIVLRDYNEHCQTISTNVMIKELTSDEVRAMQAGHVDFQLIDVREPMEYEEKNIGGELIPMNSVPANVEGIAKDKMVVVHCKSGSRSASVIEWLQREHGFTNLYNLKGGIMAW
ncbi:MAG: ThiF family adenylyltransferase [Flavobacteriales bacterium]